MSYFSCKQRHCPDEKNLNMEGHITVMTKLQVMILTAICESASNQFAMVTTVEVMSIGNLDIVKLYFI